MIRNGNDSHPAESVLLDHKKICNQMKAMIFAAGTGSRLQPLTLHKPKALVEVAGKTMLQHTLEHLKEGGVKEVVINVHHFADQVRDFLARHGTWGMDIAISDETEELLDTGGGLKKASWFFDDGKPFVVHNVDVLSNLNIKELCRRHTESQALATLAVRQRPSSRYLLFDSNNLLCGWEHVKKEEKKMIRNAPEHNRYAFSGIQVISPDLFPMMPDKKAFPITDVYLEAGKNHPIRAFVEQDSWWFDIGDPEKLEKARRFMSTR